MIRAYQEADSRAISDFFKRCFLPDLKFVVRSHEPEYYLWKYQENAWGTPAIFVAEDNNKIIGLFGVVPKLVKIQNDVIRIGETGDAYIDPEYQGKGIFFKLIAQAFKQMREQGINCFYSTANETMLKIWTGLFRFTKLFEYQSMIRPLDFSGILNSKVNLGGFSHFIAWPLSLFYKFRFLESPRVDSQTVSFKRVDSLDARLDEVWENCGKHYRFTLVKNREYFMHRFFSNPENYDFYVLQSGHEVLGYSVLKFTELFHMKCGHIVDFMVSASDQGLVEQVIGLSLEVVRREGGQFASSWALEDTLEYEIFKRFGFLGRKKRYYVVFGGDVTKREDFGLMHDKRLWSFTHGDSDNI